MMQVMWCEAIHSAAPPSAATFIRQRARRELPEESPMAMFVFAALAVIALTIAWATVAVALRQSPQEQVTMVGAGPETSGDADAQ
jgi:hypothetical protein